MKKEFRIFLTAVMFYTRIPCPSWVDHAPEYLQKSSRYLPLVGIIVGGIGAGTYLVSSLILPKAIALLLSMIATIVVTGALHEDGLADVCDGFGAGWTKEDILRIMKDSRTGIYGILGLLSVLALKFTSLYFINMSLIPVVLITGHALSRFSAVTLLYTHPYVRPDVQSKVKSAAKKMSTNSLIFAAIFGIAPLFFFSNTSVFLLLIPVFVARWYLGFVFQKRIGGQTGDCAGATQQICEVVFYLSFIIVWKFI
jgi:adenosylcobinamide-GDP ribazoletransferase